MVWVPWTLSRATAKIKIEKQNDQLKAGPRPELADRKLKMESPNT